MISEGMEGMPERTMTDDDSDWSELAVIIDCFD